MADLSAGELRAGREQAEGQLKATRAELAEVAHEVEENRWVWRWAVGSCVVLRGFRKRCKVTRCVW